MKLDVTIEKDGFMDDAAVTVAVGKVSEEMRRLINCAERAFEMAMGVARAGRKVYEIGRAIETEVRQSGFFVIKALEAVTGSGGQFMSRPASQTMKRPKRIKL